MILLSLSRFNIMPYPLDKKLVIAVASSALFDLSESDKVFREEGEEKYRQHQRQHIDKTLQKGIAFPFIRRFLNLNKSFPELQPVEVVLLSKNDPDTGLRIFRSIDSHGLSISRAAFTSGSSPYSFIPAFNVSLFLSANPNDVLNAIEAGYPAGTVMHSDIDDDEDDNELRVAFDFDGVLADDESESVFRQGNLDSFHEHEVKNSETPHNPGLLSDLFMKLSSMQKLEIDKEKDNPNYERIIRTAIITARAAPAHERVVTTLRDWGVNADHTFFLGGVEKRGILDTLKPHMFFDDQRNHLKSSAGNIPMVHIPFGIANE